MRDVRSSRPAAGRCSARVPSGTKRVHRASALDERGRGVVQFILGIFALLTGLLALLIGSAAVARYRSDPAGDWTVLVASLVLGLVTALLAGMGIFAAKVNRQRADVAARIAQSPDRPWLFVKEWEQGRIQDAPAKQGAIVLGVFAAITIAGRRASGRGGQTT